MINWIKENIKRIFPAKDKIREASPLDDELNQFFIDVSKTLSQNMVNLEPDITNAVDEDFWDWFDHTDELRNVEDDWAFEPTYEFRSVGRKESSEIEETYYKLIRTFEHPLRTFPIGSTFCAGIWSTYLGISKDEFIEFFEQGRFKDWLVIKKQ